MWSGSVLDTSSDMHPNVENGHSTGLVVERERENVGIWGSEHEGGSGREGFRDESDGRMKVGNQCLRPRQREIYRYN